MDNEISKLAHSAFVGGKEALAALIEIAELRMDENPKLSAEAYREVAAAYKHQVFAMAAKMEGMQDKVDSLERLKLYVDDHKHLLEVKELISGSPPTFAEFSEKLESLPRHENFLFAFSNHYSDFDSLVELCEVATKTENWATVFGVLRPLAFNWVVSHFSAPPTDKESLEVLAKSSNIFDLSRIADISDLVTLWPLLQLFERNER
jgi:hypothetical protein